MFGDLNGEPRYTASELLQPVTDEERQLSEQLYDAEQRENHCERQVRRFERLSEFSFDEDNRRAYGARLKLWETRDKEALFDIDETKKKIKEVQEKAKKPKTSHLLRSGALPRFVNYSFDSDDEKESENSTPESVENSGESGIIKLDDIQIFRTLSARAKNYDVLDPESGEFFKFVEGSSIQDAQVFAGKGCKKPLNMEVANGLAEQIGGSPSKWQHAKGKGVINYYGEERKAEIHWFQEETMGKHKFKVKRWLDDED